MKPVSGLQIFAVIFLLFALNACSQSQPEKSVAYSGSFRMHTANAFIGEMMQPNQTAPAPRSNTNPDPNCMDKFTRPTTIEKPYYFNKHAAWENRVARCKAGK